MHIISGDLWQVAKDFDCACVTTNGVVKKNGELVMGAGIAKECKIKYPSVPKALGILVSQNGNRVYDLGKMNDGINIVSFPTKQDYRSNSSLDLIRDSAFQLVALASQKGWTRVLVPRPGVNNGRLKWEDVKGLLENIFDDRFYIISNNPKDAIYNVGHLVEDHILNTPKVLECSSKGDKRFSAFYARVKFLGITDTIENFYQLSKRINNFVPTTVKDIKGKRPTHFVVNNFNVPIVHLTSFYKLLWLEYLDANPDLVTYAQQFDDFHDTFKGKNVVNCQADVIKQYVKEGRQSIVDEIQDFCTLINYENTKKSLEDTVAFDVQDINEVNAVTMCVTGHRPKDLFGYRFSARYKEIQNKIFACIMQFYNDFNVRHAISGGAQGVDQLFASVAQYVSSIKEDFVNEIAVPFNGQDSIWSEKGRFSKEEYRYLLSKADEVNVIDPTLDVNNAPKREISIALYARNNYMVANSKYVLGVYKGDINDIRGNDNHGSGTLQTLQMAYKLNKGIVVINPMDLSTTRINF